MKNVKRLLSLILAVTILVTAVACGQTQTASESTASASNTAAAGTSAASSPTAAPVTLTVSAAASLKDAMEEIKTAYTAQKPNVTITYNFGASGSLQQQIEQGAAVDLFLSAATKQMDALQEKGLILEDTRKNFLENKIVLIAPSDSTKVTKFEDLTSADIKNIGLGQPDSVPVGQYAKDVLTYLKLFDSIEKKVVYGKDVKEVLTWVETGNADAGMVYETDAKVSDKVKIVAAAPEGSHKPVYYPAAVIKASKNVDAAKDFINYLYGSDAKTVFEKYGFKFIAQ